MIGTGTPLKLKRQK